MTRAAAFVFALALVAAPVGGQAPAGPVALRQTQADDYTSYELLAVR